MHVSFNSHNSKISSSSKGIFDYLSKENDLENELLLTNNENFFSNDFNLVSNNGANFSKEDCIKAIDENISSDHKINDRSNYYVINIAPSQSELKHLENRTLEILNGQGFYVNDYSTKEQKLFFEEQKNIILDVLLKDYADSVMESYADSMNREIYIDTENLPTRRENEKLVKQIDAEFNSLLIENGLVEVEEKEHTIFETFEDKGDFKNGKVFNVFSEELKQTIDLFVPNHSFSIVGNQLNIESSILNNKVDELKLQEKEIVFYKKEFINAAENSNYQLVIKNEKLNKDLTIQLPKSEFPLNKEGSLSIKNKELENRIALKVIEESKKDFPKVYQKISESVEKKHFDKSDSIKAKIKNDEFKAYLKKNEILNDRQDEKFKISAEIVKENKASTLISVKPNGKDEVRLLVNSNSISSIDKDKGIILFKNQNQIERLINQAESRDKTEKQLKEIPFVSKEVVEQKMKVSEGNAEFQNIVLFKIEQKGLKEPIVIKVLEKDLVRQNGKFYLPKYQLDHKLNVEIKKGIDKEYKGARQEIKEKVWRANGFNPETRKMTKSDLLYFGKVENNRYYKGDNKIDREKINTNKRILSEISEIKAANNGKENAKTESLRKEMIRDKHTGEVIKEGALKGGNQKHVHIVVSRYDNTNPKHFKNSMSPVANSKGSEQSKGFNRHEFYKIVEKTFDNRYQYERPIEQSYEYRNEIKKEVLGHVKGEIKGKVIQEVSNLLKDSGIVNPVQQIKQEFSPIAKLKQEFKLIPFPTSFPKTKFDLLIQIGKELTKTIDNGLKM